MKNIFDAIYEIWIFVVRILILWLVITIFIPMEWLHQVEHTLSFGVSSKDWYEHAYLVIVNLIVVPAGFIFNFFNEYSQTVLDTWGADTNPIEDGVNLMLFIGSIGCALALPVAFWAMWFWSMVTAVVTFTPRGFFGGFWTADAENNWHLLSGRMTIDESFKQEQEANAIASALNKYR